ncbi:hypothetical protein C8R47DRAFT_84893, partial [Mycena vitilis]
PRARAQAHVAAVPAPSTPTQLALAPVESAAAHPASSAWELAKTSQLEQNRKWSADVKARQHRRSLPTPPAAPTVNTPLARTASLPLARSTSAPRLLPRCAPIQVASRAPPPVRLPLAERLQRACKPPAVEAVPVARLWGDVSTSFVLGFEDADYDDEEDQQQTQDTRKPATIPLASSSGSITGILNALEADILHSPAWLGRRRFLEVEVCQNDGIARSRVQIFGPHIGTVTRKGRRAISAIPSPSSVNTPGTALRTDILLASRSQRQRHRLSDTRVISFSLGSLHFSSLLVSLPRFSSILFVFSPSSLLRR